MMSTGYDGITPEDVTRIWPIAPPIQLRRTARGTNNRSFVVEGDEHTYFLKRYDNAPNPGRAAFAHSITAAIAAQHPPFAVPETILSRSGETQVLQDGRSFALTAFIPGSVATYGDSDVADACGQALANLHRALARVDLDSSGKGRPIFGNFATIHTLVPDPEAAIRDVLGDHEFIEKANAILSSVQLRCEDVTTGWPLTVIHGDFYPSNVLMRSHRVTGIVDFEFAGAGYRVMDLAIGLYAFAFGQPDMWTLIERFASGYLSSLGLSPEAIEAIPAMILMREATSLIHWTGRSLQGLTERAIIEKRARRLVDLDGFLDANGTDLVNLLHEISSRRR